MEKDKEQGKRTVDRRRNKTRRKHNRDQEKHGQCMVSVHLCICCTLHVETCPNPFFFLIYFVPAVEVKSHMLQPIIPFLFHFVGDVSVPWIFSVHPVVNTVSFNISNMSGNNA